MMRAVSLSLTWLVLSTNLCYLNAAVVDVRSGATPATVRLENCSLANSDNRSISSSCDFHVGGISLSQLIQEHQDMRRSIAELREIVSVLQSRVPPPPVAPPAPPPPAPPPPPPPPPPSPTPVSPPSVPRSASIYASCAEHKAAFPSATSGTYTLTAANGNRFDAYCDMETDGGGWTMCYSDSWAAHIGSEHVPIGGAAYPNDGYRTNCLDVPFTDVLYIQEPGGGSSEAKVWFGQASSASPTTMRGLGFTGAGQAVGGSALGAAFIARGTSGTTSSLSTLNAYSYQLQICDRSDSFYVGLMMSGVNPSGCMKECNSWCSDLSSPYFRHSYQESSGGSYAGVCFAENGHRVCSGKLMAVGLRHAP